MRRRLLSAALLLSSVMPSWVLSDERYVELPNSIWSTSSTPIEVVELFSYGCKYCYELEPKINRWSAQLPSDVQFNKVPAMVGGLWNVYGQLYLTLEVLNADEAVHAAVFEALHKRQALATPEAMALFLEGHGIQHEVFLATYRSFTVAVRVNEAIRKTKMYSVTRVPAMVVNGRYRFDQAAGGAPGMLSLAEKLIAKERDRIVF